MWVSMMGLAGPLCPLWVLRSQVLEQDQEPGWLAGCLAGRGSQHPQQSAGIWRWLSWGGYSFSIFFPLQDS